MSDISTHRSWVKSAPQLSYADVELNRLFDAVLDAGDIILEIKNGDLGVEIKSDSSPVTRADKASHHILLDALHQHFPHIPVISEEDEDDIDALTSERYFLVDPLDGTKEFIRPDSQGAFTVNIGLIDQGQSVAGIVLAPARELFFWGVVGKASYVYENGSVRSLDLKGVENDNRASRSVAIASRSHRDADTDAFLTRHNITDVISVGSSLKFGYVAMGRADIYPRFGPTMEWDTAAGEAVLAGAGGQIYDEQGHPHRYGKPGRLNGPFIACGQFNPFVTE